METRAQITLILEITVKCLKKIKKYIYIFFCFGFFKNQMLRIRLSDY